MEQNGKEHAEMQFPETQSKSWEYKSQSWNLVCQAPDVFNHRVLDKYIKGAAKSKDIFFQP